MTWFKVDDQLPDHRKVRRLGADRLPAVGLWTLCGAWASGKTDGFIPNEVVTRYDPDHFFAKRLSEVGLWHYSEDDGESGYAFHDWLEYRSSREREEKVRADTRRRVQAFRGRKRAEQAERGPDGTFAANEDEPADDEAEPSNEEGNALPPETGNATGNPAPDPTRTRTEEESPNVGGHPRSDSADADTDHAADDDDAETDREDVEALCSRLRDRIIANGSKRPRVNKTWRKDARLLLDTDEREFDKAMNLIDWCQKKPYWRGRIQSMTKFRANYDEMRLRALDEFERSRGRGDTAPVPTTTARVAAAHSLLRPEDDEATPEPDQLELPGSNR